MKLIMVNKRVIDDVNDDNTKKNQIKYKFTKFNIDLSIYTYKYIKNKLATFQFLLGIYLTNLNSF